MSVTVLITDGPLAPQEVRLPSPAGCGSLLVFEGIVREIEDGRPLMALHYQTYEPMAQTMLATLGREIVARHELIALHAAHSRGHVPVGACSFRLEIHSAHRKAALAAMDEFIDRMKQEVPIWKQAAWA